MAYNPQSIVQLKRQTNQLAVSISSIYSSLFKSMISYLKLGSYNHCTKNWVVTINLLKTVQLGVFYKIYLYRHLLNQLTWFSVYFMPGNIDLIIYFALIMTE